jgi:hypothetical protein
VACKYFGWPGHRRPPLSYVPDKRVNIIILYALTTGVV